MVTAAELVGPSLYPSPLWFPQAFDSTRKWMRMLRFDDEDYRTVPFLDKRGIRQGMPYAIVPFALLAERTPKAARRDAHWIFHISHVGSTLISRLLGELDGILALREPGLLQALPAMDDGERTKRLPVLRALLSRVFTEGHRAMVKATSNISEFAPSLVGPASENGKAAMIGMTPERFIAARLAGNLKELRARGPERLARLTKRITSLDPAEADAGDARLAAIAWATESCALETASQVIEPARLRFVDVDVFLADPAGGLEALATHFDLRASRARIEAIVAGPLMTQYAKNSAKPFDLSQREAKITAQLVDQRVEIAAAMRWIESAAGDSPVLAAALGRYA